MELEAKRRRDAGILQITERDIFALTWIAEQYSISFDQLQRLLGRHAKQATKTSGILSISATRHALDRWLQLALIETPRKVLKEHPSYIWLSRRGLSQLGLPYSYYLPKISTASHIYAVNAVRLHLESQGLLSVWQSERMLAGLTPTPDAEVRIGSLPTIAVQVIEREIKHDITLQDEVERLLKFINRYTRLWYFTPDVNVTLLSQVIKKIDIERQQQKLPQIVFYGLDAQSVLVTQEAQSHVGDKNKGSSSQQ
jgi:hypothetical protein